MVANIRSGSSPGGALRYNKEKVDKGEAEVLFRQKMLEPFDRYGRLDIDACMESFRPYLEANRRTTNTVFHVSLNPSPEDKLNSYGKPPRSIWNVWDMEINLILFSSIMTFPESISIWYRCVSMRTDISCRMISKQNNGEQRQRIGTVAFPRFRFLRSGTL